MTNSPTSKKGVPLIPSDAMPAVVLQLFTLRTNMEDVDWKCAAATLIRHGERPIHTAHRVIRALMDYLPDDPQAVPGKVSRFSQCEMNYSEMLCFVRDAAFAYNFRDNEYAERIIAGLARRCMYGSFEHMTDKLLSRRPSAEEVLTLTRAYCTNKASRGTDTEKTLRSFADRYCDPATRAQVHALIKKFIQEWENRVDL